jgi:hypothetical protein
MAKVKYGSAVAEASGAAGGAVFSRNRNGSYLRRFSAPVQPRSVTQVNNRENVGALSNLWRTLTTAEKAAWASLGAQIVRSDSLGQSYDLTGAQAFTGNNNVRRHLGVASTTTAPALDVTPSITTAVVTATSAGQTISLAYTATGGLAGNTFLVFATSAQSAGKSFFSKGDYKFIGSFAGNAASPVTLAAGWIAVFGAFQLGTKISFLIVPASANYFTGAAFRVDAIAV